jgi:hypothetical protein
MNETTKQTPFNLLIGGLPVSHYPMTEDQLSEDERMDHIHKMRSRAKEAITKAQDVMRNKKGTNYKPYQEQDRVWLEATNLKTTHPTAKLASKRYRPFTIKKRVSDVVFQLELPLQWKIHDVFHASLLTPYVETELHGPNFPEPPLEITEGDPEFEVKQIIGSRRIERKKTLQYKIRWKGYSPAHDSWELAIQVHALELIKEFQKNKSSRKNNATINYQSASRIQSRPSPLTRPRAYAFLPEAESSKPNVRTDKGFTSGKRTQDSPITQTGNKDQRSSSNSDKRQGQDSKKKIIVPSFFHINSCAMENNYSDVPPPLTVEEIRNMDLSNIDPTPTKIYNELNQVLREAWYSDQRETTGDENTLAGPSNQLASRTTVEDDDPEKGGTRSKQTSLALTEDLHPGYPYRENIKNNNDLPKDHYPRPYLAAQVNLSNGDLRILGKAERGAPMYNEGPLTAQPMAVVKDDFEEEVATYPLGENVYLDTNFLQAMEELDDQGLAAESLHLVQIDGEFRYLEQWERHLKIREQAIHLEQGDFIQRKRGALSRQTEVYKHLRKAKVASRLVPKLHNRLEGPGLSFPQQTRPYTHPAQPEQRHANQCYWCGSSSLLYGHKSKDCALPHQRCDSLAPRRCVVPIHHNGYYSFIDAPETCLYKGNHKGVPLSGEHA